MREDVIEAIAQLRTDLMDRLDRILERLPEPEPQPTPEKAAELARTLKAFAAQLRTLGDT